MQSTLNLDFSATIPPSWQAEDFASHVSAHKEPSFDSGMCRHMAQSNSERVCAA